MTETRDFRSIVLPGGARAAAGRAAFVIGAMLVLVLATGPSLPAAPSLDEERAAADAVKANILWKFGNWVTWPEVSFANEESPIVIGVLADDAFAATLERAIRGKTVQHRSLAVRRLRPPTGRPGDPTDMPTFLTRLATCHTVYVSESRRAGWDRIRAPLEEMSILTVSDMPRFKAEEGGMIEFFLAGDTIQFRINQKLAEQRRLKISSRLMRLSK